MIIEAIIGVVMDVIIALFSLFPDLPDVPVWLSSALDQSISYISMGMGFVYCFIPKSALAVAIPTVIAIHYWREIYFLIMWVVHKLPFSID